MAKVKATKEYVESRAKHTWTTGETITADLLNALETTADTAKSTAETAKSTAEGAKTKAEAACPKTQSATTAALGLVKQCTKVNDAAGESVTKAEFNALLAAMKTAGMMANS